MERVRFKTRESLFWKENDGLKPNTVRTLEGDDERKKILDKWIRDKKFGEIEIMDLKSKACFARVVVDVTRYRGLYIISWKHPPQWKGGGK